MEDIPPFLSALGLDTSADERAVRSAYAQRLKRIDQTADAAGFQQLREHYEIARMWANLMAGEQPEVPADTAAPNPPPPPSHPPPVTVTLPMQPLVPAALPTRIELPASLPLPVPNADALGDQVFVDFVAALRAGFRDDAEARGALDAALADPRSVNLDARSAFEWRIAALLLEGWRPGRELLFDAACEAFGWIDDRRRLGRHGPLGADLDAAITEQLIWARQDAPERDAQHALIRRLRDATPPTPKELRTLTPLLHSLGERYPNWLRLMAPREPVEQWLQAYAELPEAQRLRIEKKAAQAAAPSWWRRLRQQSKEQPPRFSKWMIAWAVVMFVSLVSRLAAGLGDPTPLPLPLPTVTRSAPGTSPPATPPTSFADGAANPAAAAPTRAPAFDISPSGEIDLAPLQAVKAKAAAEQEVRRRQREAETALQRALAAAAPASAARR